MFVPINEAEDINEPIVVSTCEAIIAITGSELCDARSQDHHAPIMAGAPS
jgi:hypothetical protein